MKKKYMAILGALLLIAASGTAYAQIRDGARATGGGSIIGPSEGKATFGFVALSADGADESRGNLLYIDHAAKLIVRGKVEYLNVYGNTAVFSGTAEIRNAAGTTTETFTVTAVDNGKPGKGNDIFTIVLENGYSASGTLKSGNIRVSGSGYGEVID